MENKEYIEKLQGLSNADLIDECCFNYNMALLLKKGNDDLKELEDINIESSIDYLNRYQSCKEEIISRMKQYSLHNWKIALSKAIFY